MVAIHCVMIPLTTVAQQRMIVDLMISWAIPETEKDSKRWRELVAHKLSFVLQKRAGGSCAHDFYRGGEPFIICVKGQIALQNTDSIPCLLKKNAG